jgi:hypothetical protein
MLTGPADDWLPRGPNSPIVRVYRHVGLARRFEWRDDAARLATAGEWS